VTASKNATSQTVTGLFPERAYRFQVKSFNSAGSSAAAGPVDATTLRQPPAAPQNLKVASQTTSSVILTWTDCSENEDGFRIEQTQGDGKTWGRSATTGPNTQAAEVTGLASGQKYDFRVFAFNSAGDSLPAGPVTTTITGTPPAKPLVLSASNPTATTVDVAWTDASSNELAFVIEGSRDLGQTWGELASTLANVVRTTLTGLAPETRYQLRVVATNAAGKSGSSNVVEVTTLGQPPAAPDNLAFDPNTLTATGVELTWRDNSATESEFEVFRSPGAVGSWERVGATGANVTRYKATGLSALTSYQFRVRAKNVWGVSTDSAAVVVTTRMSPPNAPQKLTASNITARSLDLAWIDCSQDEDDFLIACSINGGPFAPLAVVARNVTKYAVSNLQPLTKYCFQVQARNQGGGSDFTPAVCLQTKGVPPTAPSGFEVRSVTGTTAALAWKDTSGNEDEFVVVGRIDGEPADRLLAKFGANQVTGTLTGLKAATRYLLKLQARNTWGESDFAGPVECLTAFVIPDVPQQLTAVSASGTQIDLSWTLAEQFVDWFDVHYRLEGSEAWSASQPSPPGSARRTSVTGLNPDTRYDFRIRAVVNRAGASDWSNVATAATRMVLPNPPANLAVGTVTATTVDLSWQDASNNEAEFQVSLSADQGTNWKVVGASSANTPRFQVRDLKPQTEYRFRVQACNGAGCSEPTAAVSATTKQAPPPIPTDLVVDKVQARQLDLSWRDVPEETGYEIERSLDGGTTFAPLTKTGANQTRVTVTGLEPRKQVVFRVRAVNSAGYSDWSKPVGGTTLDEIPAIPGKPSVVSTTSRSIDLKWADNSDNESEFVLEMSDNAGRDWKIAARTAANTPRALVSGLLPLKEYAFRAQARNDVGASSFSEILRETTGGEAPQPPECLVATNVTQGTADLAWVDKSSDEQFFDVEISRDRRQSWQPFKTVAANVIKLPVTGLEAGTEYWFQVRARNSYGSSAPAGPVKVETLGTPPARPVLALDGFDSTTVDLSWNIPKSQVTSLELSSSLDQGRNWTVVARPKPTETKARVSNLTAATEYRFRLEAFNGTVSSGTSNEVVARTKSLIPAAPSQLKVSEPSATSLKLTWCDNSTNETKFEIEISDTDGASFVPLGATAANVTSFSVGSLVENRKYCFRVLARNDGGASAWSETACGSTLAKVPAAPTDLVVKSATANSAVVQWKAGPLPFDAFQISWRPAGQSTWTTQKKLPATTLTETLTGLAIDTAYEVTVSAFNAGVESKANPVVSFVTIPAAPTGFCTLNPTANSLTLKWNDASQTEGEYRLQRSTDGGKTWSAQEKLAANSTSRVVDSLAADTSHRFRLVAANGAGESAAVEAEGRTLVAPPSAPTNLKALAVNADSVQLSWTDTSANETGFEVFRSDDERQTWRSAGQTAANATSLTDKGLASLKKYWYRVRAFNAAGNSEFSDWLEVTTLLAVPKAPSGVCVVNPKPTTLDVKWTDNSDNEDAFVVLVSSDKVVFREGARVGAGANCATLTGLVAETDYTVKVQALNRAGTSGDSNLATGRTARRAPDQVGGLRIIDKSSTTLTLAWDSPDARATVLQLDISRDGGLSWQYCQSPRRDSTSTMVGDLSPNREYVFRIRAENEAGVSSWSAETRGCTLPPPPASPTNFAAKSVGNIKLTLTWKNVATDANRNLIRISYDQGQTFQDFALLDFFNESWVITGLKPNTPYVFELFAVNGGLFSAPIPRLTVTTDCTPPTDPSNLRAVNIGTNSVDLAWKGASREEGYEFEVSTDGGSSWRFFDTSPADKVEYRATGLKRNQRYRFRVRAVNSVRKSSWAVSEDFRTK
jgi:fibronectin type 3 domain-containing protein